MRETAAYTRSLSGPVTGWRVEEAEVGTWKSLYEWGVPPALVSGDAYALILKIKPPAAPGAAVQEVPYDVAVFDQKHQELTNESGTLKNLSSNGDSWMQEVQLGQVPRNVSDLTVELRSEGKFVVRYRIPVEDAGDPPPVSAVQRLVGHWQSKGKRGDCKALGDLQVNGAGPYPEFTFEYHCYFPGNYNQTNTKLSGRLRLGKGDAWVAREMVGRICYFNRDCGDLNDRAKYLLSIEDDGKNGLRVEAPWDLKEKGDPPIILTKK